MKKKFLFAAFILLLVAISLFIFRKKENKSGNSIVVTDLVPENPKFKTLSLSAAYFTDMEDPDPTTWAGGKNSEHSFSGKFSNKLSDKVEYGITFSKKGIEIPLHKTIKQARISFKVFSKDPINKTSIVYSVTGPQDKVYEYFQDTIIGQPGEWAEAEFVVPVNSTLWGEDALVKIYSWNEGKEVFYIDDIKIDFLSEVENHPGITIGPQQNYFFGFEPENDVAPAGNQSKEVAHSGSYSMKLSGTDSYSENITKKISDVSTDTIKFISTSVWIYPKEDNPVVTLVVSIEKPNGTSISWQGKATDKMNLKKKEWQKINFRADLREIKTAAEDVIKIYLWNKIGGTVYADDLEIVYGDIPKPGGTSAGVLMNLAGDLVGQHENNKPPFPPDYFSPVPLFTPVSVFLVDNGGKKEGEMNPGNLMFPGSFLSRNISQDDIFIADEKNWSLYSWCENINKFMKTFSVKAASQVNGKIILHGFFDDLKQEVILLIDTGSKIRVQTIRFNGNAENICSKKTTEENTFETSETDISGPDIHGNAWKIVAGNFTGDDKEEIIFISDAGQWKLFQKKERSFEVMSSGSISRGTVLSIHPVTPGNKHKKLLVFSERNKKLDYFLVDFNAGKNNCSVTDFKDKSFLTHYDMHAVFFSCPFEKPGSADLFYLNKEWRFDLKKVQLTGNGIFIKSQIDFVQPDAMRNPKYYEYTSLISGKFLPTGVNQLLVMMRNCKDADFDGNSCREFEEVKGMPSWNLFYQYKPEQ